MNKPSLLRQIEETLGYTFEKVLDIDIYYQDPENFPQSYRDEVKQEEEMVRDWHGGTAFLNAQVQVVGINLYDCKVKADKLQALLKLPMPDLQALNLNQTGVQAFAFSDRMPSLVHVNLSQNESLTEVRFEETPAQLRSLDVYDSRVKALDLPAGMDQLEKLDASRNQMERLSFAGCCKELGFVDASDNQLGELVLPEGFDALQYLFLKGNQLSRFEIAENLPQIDILDLRNNKLEEFSENFHLLRSLRNLFLSGNSWSRFPEGIIPEGERADASKAVLSYLQSVFAKGTRPNERVKMILVGNGRVGKTSLFKQLNGEAFDPHEKYTHGIQIGALHEDKLPLGPDRKLNLKVWDFGGQVIFHATHQFFLSDDALYVLAWADPKRVREHQAASGDALSKFEEPWRSEESWLDNIRHLAPESPVLMVQTHVASEKQKIPIAEDKYQAAPYAVSCLTFDAETKRNLPDLQDWMVSKLVGETETDRLKLYGEEIANQYLNVVERVTEKVEKEKVPFIEMEAFHEICDKEELNREDHALVLSYLHRTGVVVYLGQEDRPSLENIIFIDPNWLLHQVYRIIDRKLEAREGVIDAEYLSEVFPLAPEDKENEPRQKELAEEKTRLLELLTRFELIFQDPEEDGLFYAPQYLPAEPDRKTERMIRNNKGLENLAFVFRFPRYVPENVMINFVCRYGPQANTGTVPWKNGIVFSFENRVSCRVLFERHDLQVYIEPHSQAAAAAYKICQSFVELSRRANAEVSRDGETFVNWEELQDAAEMNEGQGYIRSVCKTQKLTIEDFHELLGTRYEGRPKNDSGERYDREEKGTDPNLSQLIPELVPMKAAITQLITENRLKEALQKLAEIVSEAHRGEVAVLQSRLTELDQNISRGTISRSDITIERNQIVHAALGLLALSPDTGISATVSNANAPQDPSPEDNGKQNKILFLAANPANATRLQTDKEHRILKAEYSRGSIPATFLPPQFALTLGELQRALDDEPTIIHFSGHGDEDGIIITNEQNQHELLKPFALERIFKRMQGKTKLVILNACFSSIQAKTISGFDMVVLGANHEVEDEACIKFSKAFYSALGRGKSFEQCYDEAITEVGNYDEDEASLFEAWQEGQKLDW